MTKKATPTSKAKVKVNAIKPTNKPSKEPIEDNSSAVTVKGKVTFHPSGCIQNSADKLPVLAKEIKMEKTIMQATLVDKAKVVLNNPMSDYIPGVLFNKLPEKVRNVLARSKTGYGAVAILAVGGLVLFLQNKVKAKKQTQRTSNK